MEHLTLPKYRTIKEHPVIPYVCEEAYDEGDFLSYPKRANVPFAILPSEHEQSGLSHGHDYPSSQQESECFLQKWLFFGLIHTILGRYIRPQDLVYDYKTASTPQKVLKTSSVPIAVQRWVEDVKAERLDPMPRYQYISSCLSLTFSNLKDATPHINQNMAISYISLGEMLCFAANDAFNVVDLINENRCPNQWHTLVNDSYWKDRMTANGFCRSQIGLILNASSSVHMLYFTSHLSQAKSERGHEGCKENECSAYQNDIGDYRTQHVDTTCNCQHFAVQTSQLFKILQDGYIPLLRIAQGAALSEFSVDLVSSKDCPKYLALSHVWAEGLGNPTRNALPCCQLAFLRRLLDDLKPSLDLADDQEILLWCDSMCCPAEEGEAKKLGMLQMKKTYLEASSVLVLSKTLQEFDLNEFTISEAAIRIFTSPWMRRLWTLQEAALSLKDARLWFRFKGGFMRIRTLIRGIAKEFSENINAKALANDLVTRSTDFFTFYSPDPNSLSIDFQVMAEGLRYRSVSCAADEPLLLANLLNLEVKNILSCTSHSERMQQLWNIFPNIPMEIVFWMGPRLQQTGFKWAPATLLKPSSRRSNMTVLMNPAESCGTLTERGLLVTFPGYSISLPQRPRHLRFIDQSNIQAFMVDLSYLRGDDGRWFSLVSSLPQGETDELPIKFPHSVIKESKLRLMHMPIPSTHWESPERGSSDCVAGLVVHELDRQADIRYVKSLMHIFFIPMDKAWGALLEAAYHQADKILLSDSVQKLTQSDEIYNERDASDKEDVVKAVKKEAERVASSSETPTLALANKNVGHGKGSLKKLLTNMALGNFGCLSDKTSEGQRWCVD